MGYRRLGRAFAVDLPLAVGIASGLRVAAVSNVSIVSVASLIGYPQLGYYLTDGYERDFPLEIATGMVGCLLLALVFDTVIRAGAWHSPHGSGWHSEHLVLNDILGWLTDPANWPAPAAYRPASSSTSGTPRSPSPSPPRSRSRRASGWATPVAAAGWSRSATWPVPCRASVCCRRRDDRRAAFREPAGLHHPQHRGALLTRGAALAIGHLRWHSGGRPRGPRRGIRGGHALPRGAARRRAALRDAAHPVGAARIHPADRRHGHHRRVGEPRRPRPVPARRACGARLRPDGRRRDPRRGARPHPRGSTHHRVEVCRVPGVER